MKKLDIKKLPIRQLRQRMFVKQSSILYDSSEYTFKDNIPEQIEALDGFTDWESFSHKWDVLWVGLDPRAHIWVPGRHHSPMREVVTPLRIVPIDERNKKMMLVPVDRKDIESIPLPGGRFEESEEDRAISESLSGKVVIDEPDEEKAARMIEATMKDLENKLALIKGMTK